MGQHWGKCFRNFTQLWKRRQTLGIHMALISLKGPLFNLYIKFLKKYHHKSMMISFLSLHLAADPSGNPTKLFSNLIMNGVLMIPMLDK